jgi:protein subunit release factor A
LSLHNMESFLDGDLDPMIDALSAEEHARLLEKA